MPIYGFPSSAGGGGGTTFYQGWNQPQMPSGRNTGAVQDQLQLLQAQGDQARGQQELGLQYGAANAAADRGQRQWEMLTGNQFTGSQNDANRALQQALQNSSQTFQGNESRLTRDWTGTQNQLGRDFEANQALLGRDWTSQENNLQRGWTSGENDRNRQLTASEGAANRGLQLTMQGNQFGFEGGQADLNRNFTGSQNQLNRDFEGGQNDANRALQRELSMAPLQFQKSKFNAVMPLISNILGGHGGQMNMGFAGGGGGPMPAQQQTKVGDMFTPEQIQQQVNAAKAGNAQQAQTAVQQQQRGAGGRGISSGSPLLAALQGQIQAAQMAGDADSERGIRLGSAQANAQNRLQTGQLAEQQWLNAQDQALRRQQLGYAGPASLLSALGGFA